MHKSNFVVCVKTGGKILREKKDQVALPFGSEYSLLLKNLESRRAQVKVSIDGDDVTGSCWLIIQPNGTLELERFIRNDNLKEGNRFKFIERIDAVEKGRGIKADDGLIRVEFKYEQVWNSNLGYLYNYSNINTKVWPSCGSTFTLTGVFNSNVTVASCSLGAMSQSQQNVQLNSGKNDEIGVTVPGSKSDQQFYDSYGFICGSSEVITLHLVGKSKGEPVVKASVAREKQVCVTCTKRNKSYANFCSQCGTALELF